MSNRIAITIEGAQAKDALAELLAIDGIVGDAPPAHPGPVYRGAGLVEAVGAIVAITGGAASIVSNVLAWREKWQKQRETKRLSVVIQDARGNRLALENATAEQIEAALQTLTG
jgi:hypothetical protein